jgi:hypothetical protein
MILALYQMLCYLMGMTVVDDDDSQVVLSGTLIRLFLTALENLDNKTRTVNNKPLPTWVSQYNYQCLLNIPRQIQLLGPIQNRWEGGKCGEGFLRIVKPIIQSGRKNWQRNLFRKIVQMKSLIMVRDEDDGGSSDSDESDSEENQQHEPQSFVVYPGLASLLRDCATAKALSVVLSNDGVFGCYRSSSMKRLLEFQVVENTADNCFGLWYHALKVNDVDNVEDACLEEVHVTCYGLLLPFAGTTWPPIPQQDTNSKKYALVTSNWMSWDEHRNVVQPYQFLWHTHTEETQ